MKQHTPKLLSLLLVMAVLLSLVSGAVPAHAEDALVEITLDGTQDFAMAAQVVQIMNEERAAAGLSPLTVDPVLMDYAMQRAAEVYMYYSHTRPDGTSCFSIYGDDYTYGAMAENIALGQSSASDVMYSWMHSDGHRANILNPELNSVGVGCFYQPDGSIAWVQLFYSGVSTTSETRTSAQLAKDVSIWALSSNLAGYVQHHYFSNNYCAVYLYEGTTTETQFYLINPLLNWVQYVTINNDNVAYHTDKGWIMTVDEGNVLRTISPGQVELSLTIDGANINIMDDAGYITTSATVEVMEMPELTYTIDDQGNIHVDYSGFNSTATLFYKGNHDEMWIMGNREADGIYTHYNPDPTDTYVYVMRYWDYTKEEYVELGERLVVQLGNEEPDVDPDPDPDPDPEPEPDPVPDLDIPHWDSEPTLEQVADRIAELMEIYPKGTQWAHDPYTWLGGNQEFFGMYDEGTGYGQMSWCMGMSDLIFGDLPARQLNNPTLDDLRIGDIITTKYKGEYIITKIAEGYIAVSTVVDNTIYYYQYPSEEMMENIIAALTRYESDSPGVEAQTPSIIPEDAVIVASGNENTDDGHNYLSLINWALDAEGTLYIYGYGPLNNTTMHLSWQDYADQVKRLVIGPDITEIGRQNFKNFYYLEEVVLGKDITIIHDNAFQYCSSLKTVHFPEGLTEICESAFSGAALEELVLPETVTILGDYAFSGNAMERLELHGSFTEFGRYVFAGCTELEEIVLAEELTFLGYGMFRGCEALTTLSLPGNLLEVPEYCFESCYNLETVYIGMGTEIIDDYAFYLCRRIQELHLPNSLLEIGDAAFDSCEMITDLYFYGTYEQWMDLPVGYNNTCFSFILYLHIVDPDACMHTNTTVIAGQEPTCTAPGLSDGSICADCGEVLTEQEEVPALGHDWSDWQETLAPTEETPGQEQRSCYRCGEAESRDTECLEHTHDFVVTEQQDPTCTEAGYTTYTCKCGESYVADEVPALGHSYVDGVCERCGAGEHIVGDVSGDGNVNARDIRALLNILASGEAADPAVADFNGDGLVNARDIRALLNYLAS